MHHVLDGVEYGSSLQNGSQRTFPTLEGTDIHLTREANGTVLVSASGGWLGMQSELKVRDLLSQTGVIHELSDVIIPRSVELTVGKLVKAAKGSTMASLVSRAGMEWILNGTSPPEGSAWDELGLAGAGWTLLVPTDDAFKQVNLTTLRADPQALRMLISQHLIPTPVVSSPKSDLFGTLAVAKSMDNSRPLSMTDDATYSTLLSPESAYGDLVFRELESDGRMEFVVGIRGARGTEGREDWARVLSWGRTTRSGRPSRSILSLNGVIESPWLANGPGGEGTGGVILIDRLLVPYHPPWFVEYGGPAAVGAVGIVAILAFFYVVRLIWRRDVTEATFEPLGGFAREEDE